MTEQDMLPLLPNRDLVFILFSQERAFAMTVRANPRLHDQASQVRTTGLNKTPQRKAKRVNVRDHSSGSVP
jgi:hypothetical protein